MKVKAARYNAEKHGPDAGEAYTFTGLGTSSRFVITWRVGKRDQATCDAFTADLRSRLLVMPAMTSDGFAPYITAIGASFGPGVDYAQTVKNYTKGGRRPSGDHRYEPARDPFIVKKTIFGAPDLSRASTAYMERQNGTMRSHIGRMRRLCLAFSKDLEHHKAAAALCYAHYNLCWIVKTLRVTPAMAAGVTDHVWSLEEFMDAALSADPASPIVKRPLEHRAPAEPARELPNGRGFLRLLPGGNAPAPSSGPAVPPPVAASAGAPVAAPLEAPVPELPSGQLDLLAWRPKPPPPPPAPKRLEPGQLDLFGLDFDPKFTK